MSGHWQNSGRRPSVRVGITGAGGFIGSHLARQLTLDATIDVTRCTRAHFAAAEQLSRCISGCNSIVHLAAMDRGSERELFDVNVGLVNRLIEALSLADARPHIVFASSTERDRATAYGRAKRECERQLRAWAGGTGGRVTILIIPEAFGPGCRPYHNSVVATFCEQLANDQEPVVIDDYELALVSVHDLIDAIRQIMGDEHTGVREARVPPTAQLGVSKLLEKLRYIRDCYFNEQVVPSLAEAFDSALYTTFLSHIDIRNHLYRPKMYIDARGELCEIMKMVGGGQMFFSTTRPGVVRGNHFHTRKIEWLCVVRGDAIIRLCRVGETKWRQYRVSGREPQFITIPPLWTHQIENVGAEEMLTMFWCNEIFEAGNPDTFHDESRGEDLRRAA